MEIPLIVLYGVAFVVIVFATVIAPWWVRKRREAAKRRFHAELDDWRSRVADNFPRGARDNFEARMDEGNYDNLNVQLARSIDSRIGDIPRSEVRKEQFFERRRRKVERTLQWPDERPKPIDPTKSSWDYYQENGNR